MKKRVIALLLCLTTVFAMTACGSENGNVDNTETEAVENLLPAPDLAKYEFTYADYVTLGVYNGIPIELSESYEVTEETVTEYLEWTFETYGPFYGADDTKTVIAEGDIVNVNYVGKLDGVAFDGGAAENQLIDVSGNCAAGGGTTYIDGFTAGLLGAEVGTEVDCPVTFPEEYHSADLAGKDVVFTFTVNSIQKPISVDEMDDAFALEYFGEETVEDLRAMLLTDLTNEAIYYRSAEITEAVQTYLLEVCTVEIPADYFDDMLTAYKNMFINQNCDGDESQLESFLSTNYGYTLEEAEEMWTEGLRTEIQFEFILNAIAEEKGITLDEASYQEYVDAYYAYGGYEDMESMYAAYGYGDEAYGEKYLQNVNIWNQVMETLEEAAEITVKETAAE